MADKNTTPILPKGLEARPGNSIRVRVYFRGSEASKTVRGDLSESHIETCVQVRDRLMDRLSASLDYDEDAGDSEGKAYHLHAAYQRVFLNSRKRKKDRYHLSKDDEGFIIDRCGGKCELTGIPFDLTKKDWARRPYAPSLDRIDSSGDYTIDNTRMVCCAINIALNEWGEGVYATIASAYIFGGKSRSISYDRPFDPQEFSIPAFNGVADGSRTR